MYHEACIDNVFIRGKTTLFEVVFQLYVVYESKAVEACKLIKEKSGRLESWGLQVAAQCSLLSLHISLNAPVTMFLSWFYLLSCCRISRFLVSRTWSDFKLEGRSVAAGRWKKSPCLKGILVGVRLVGASFCLQTSCFSVFTVVIFPSGLPKNHMSVTAGKMCVFSRLHCRWEPVIISFKVEACKRWLAVLIFIGFISLWNSTSCE